MARFILTTDGYVNLDHIVRIWQEGSPVRVLTISGGGHVVVFRGGRFVIKDVTDIEYQESRH
jgi:hypothetical protein